MKTLAELNTEAGELRRLGDRADPEKVEKNWRARMEHHDRFFRLDSPEELERRARYLGGTPRLDADGFVIKGDRR